MTLNLPQVALSNEDFIVWNGELFSEYRKTNNVEGRDSGLI
jgi:hypothetical protein